MNQPSSERDVGRPLAGLRVVVTRPVHQAGGLVSAFADAGARVAELPLLAVVPPADPDALARAAEQLSEPGRFDWVVFSSANAVDALFAHLADALPPNLRTAAVGPATADALRRRGVEPEHEARQRDAAGLAAELAPLLAQDRGGSPLAAAGPGAADAAAPARVLLPQAADARPALARDLAAAGADVVAVVAYDKRLPAGAAERALAIFGDDPSRSLGWVTFTSPRIVAHFVELLGAAWEARRATLKAASIGPVTSRALARHGVAPAAEAAAAGDRELVAAVVRCVVKGA